MNSKGKELVIVTGATGDVGEAFLKRLKGHPADLVGMHRSPVADPLAGVTYCGADLTDPAQVAGALTDIDMRAYRKISIIHPVGKFKWEEHGTPERDHDFDGIDDEVYESNVDSFTNVVRPVLAARPSAKINVACFGSLSDKARVPFWQSYSAAKNEVRARMRGLVAFDSRVASTMVNLPSVDTKNENAMRPFADKTYWMAPDAVAEQSLDLIMREGRDYREVDRYVHSPEYHEGYYRNLAAVYARWRTGMIGNRN